MNWLKVGITGHRRLSNPAAWTWVREELGGLLRKTTGPVVGVTSLAIGADQLLAEIVLELNGDLESIIPFPDYEQSFENELELDRYNRLRALSKRVEVQPGCGAHEEAYLRAGERVVDLSDLLIAVWDGHPSRGVGGTADVVRYALAKGKRVVHLNPVSCRMETLRAETHA